MNERPAPDQPIDIDSVESLQELVRDGQSILVVGNRTKPALCSADAPTQRVTTKALTGITEYEPSEFTFTALAGTPLEEIRQTLAEKNQYLPFDPMLAGRGATIGGTLAAGMSGPGRHRYGGVRDFVLGAQFVAGDGQFIRSGGKVVKNAAGFDIPKLLVGSCGRLAGITALTFKVFPRPCEFHTYQIECDGHDDAAKLIAAMAGGRWELDAIDYRAETRSIWVRLGGEKKVCESIIGDICDNAARREAVPMATEHAVDSWSELSELQFGGPTRQNIVKIPMILEQMQRLAHWCDEYRDRVSLHASVAGSIGWLALADGLMDDVELYLKEASMTGLVIRGPARADGLCFIGAHHCQSVESAIKRAMDPPGRFPSFSG